MLFILFENVFLWSIKYLTNLFLLYFRVSNCDIVLFIFHHCQVQNFKILNESERDLNFAEDF